MKIYVIQVLDYSDYDLIYVGTSKEEVSKIMKENAHKKYLELSIWLEGKEIEDGIKATQVETILHSS